MKLVCLIVVQRNRPVGKIYHVIPARRSYPACPENKIILSGGRAFIRAQNKRSTHITKEMKTCGWLYER
jgi:hypothetical protein